MLNNASIDDKAMLKFDLLVNGIRVSETAFCELRRKGCRLPTISRSGASHGIEAVIEGDLFVNIPLSNDSQYSLSDDCNHVMNDERKMRVTILKRPAFYDDKAGDLGMEQVGRVCFDRLGITLTSNCFFREQGMGCKFCGIGCSDHGPSERILRADEINPVIRAALNDPTSGVRHVLLSSGTFAPPDFGASYYAECVEFIKKEFSSLSVYIMIPPPLEREYLYRLLRSGVDEIAMNIELFGDSAYDIVPGKSRIIGKKHYLESLKYLSGQMSKYAVRSILMSSIENPENTLRGVEELAKRKVMPIISVYRKIGNSFHLSKEFDTQYMFSLWKEADAIVRRYDMLLGPLCIPCQSNTIVLPTHKDYCFY